MLLTYNIYTSESNITCCTALWASVQRWMWLISRWLEHSKCNVGRKTGLYFQLFMLSEGNFGNKQSGGRKNHLLPVAELGSLLFPVFLVFFFRSVPWPWLWHKANAWAYDVNKHLHCRHVFLVWMAEMAVGEQRKEVMPQFLWLQPSSLSTWKKIAQES